MSRSTGSQMDSKSQCKISIALQSSDSAWNYGWLAIGAGEHSSSAGTLYVATGPFCRLKSFEVAARQHIAQRMCPDSLV